MGRKACTEPQYLYIIDIHLLPVWVVDLVQSLRACTVQLHLCSPYRPYGLYRASLPVQYSYTSTAPIGRTACTEPHCLYSTAIPLLPLWAVRPVQSLTACTRVHTTFLLSHRVGHTESSKYVWILIFSCLYCYSEVEWDERMYADWFSRNFSLLSEYSVVKIERSLSAVFLHNGLS